jgi:tetraacyldisaccharide 4'-kinase
MVVKVVGELVRAGRFPCIAMRGYKKDANATGESDEAAEYARLLPGVPVVAQPDRISGLRALFGTPEGRRVDCVVLDDGFQHRKIARDVDVVLIDATAGTLHDRLLPAGWLREPMESLARAGAVVVTHSERAPTGEVERIREAALRINPGLVVAVCRHVWTGLRTDGGVVAVESLRGKSACVVSGIGNPRAFEEGVRGAGAKVRRGWALADHAAYDSATVEWVLSQAAGMDCVVTTEKDWTKLGKVNVQWPCPVYRPVLELVFDSGWEALWEAVARGAGRRGVGGASVTSPTLMVGKGEVASP